MYGHTLSLHDALPNLEVLCMGVTGIGAERIREGVRALSRLVRGDLSSDSRRIEDEAVEPLRGKALQRAMAGTTLLYNTVYGEPCRSEEHTSELQSLMRISYAVFCLKKKTLKKS